MNDNHARFYLQVHRARRWRKVSGAPGAAPTRRGARSSLSRASRGHGAGDKGASGVPTEPLVAGAEVQLVPALGAIRAYFSGTGFKSRDVQGPGPAGSVGIRRGPSARAGGHVF